jgi:hypothetical protein
LSLAIQETFGQEDVDVSRKERDLETIDVGCDEGFAKLLKVRATWVHGAPPCKTFSRARRNDHFAKVKCLRTEERPQGFGSEAADVANKLALRMLEIAKGQMARGEFFSIENPFSSLLWKMKQYEKLAAEKGVRLVRVHQCMAGSMHKKETGVLTNAPWLADLLCDNESRPHHHVPLIGVVEDFREKSSKQVFYTELAAEYPEGLCSLWAKDFHKYCKRAEDDRREEAGGDRRRQRTALSAEASRAQRRVEGHSCSRNTALSAEASRAQKRVEGHSYTRRTALSAEACRAQRRVEGPSYSRRALSAEACRGLRPVEGPSRVRTEFPGAATSSGGGDASDIQRGDPLMAAKAGELATSKSVERLNALWKLCGHFRNCAKFRLRPECQNQFGGHVLEK